MRLSLGLTFALSAACSGDDPSHSGPSPIGPGTPPPHLDGGPLPDVESPLNDADMPPTTDTRTGVDPDASIDAIDPDIRPGPSSDGDTAGDTASGTDGAEDGENDVAPPCDPQSPLPGVFDGCNGVDDDCDGLTDEDAETTLCAITNAFGTCTGTLFCNDGEEECVGEEANTCGGCGPPPDDYGDPCGCGGTVGCNSACENDVQSGCIPQSCFVGPTAVTGTVGCGPDCTGCDGFGWKACQCVVGNEGPTLIVVPSNVDIGDPFDIHLWSPEPILEPVLRFNGVLCVANPGPACDIIDGCGGHTWVWTTDGQEAVQLGSNTLEVFDSPSAEICDGSDGTTTPLAKAFVPIQ